jgi:metallo-beta-lactamase class B
MKRYLPSLTSLIFVLLVGGRFSNEVKAQTSTPESHEAAAKAAAYTPGHDYTWIFDRNCGEFSKDAVKTLARTRAAAAAAPAPAAPATRAARRIPPRELWYQPPAKIFDNLYYLGSHEMLLADGTYTQGLAIWAVRTSDGIILHDTAFDYMVEDQIVNGLRQMGLNAADIKYAIVSHGHSDHYFGAKMLQDRFGTRIIMSAAYWELVANDDNPPEIKPRKDMVATDGMELTLGDTTLTLYLTPGHTPGTISTLIPLRDGDRWHLGSIWGGNAMNFQYWSEIGEGLRVYGDSARRFKEITAKARVDVFLASHTNHDKTLDRINGLRFRPPGAPHSFVDAEAVQRHLTVVGECAQAQLGWYLQSLQ